MKIGFEPPQDLDDCDASVFVKLIELCPRGFTECPVTYSLLKDFSQADKFFGPSGKIEDFWIGRFLGLSLDHAQDIDWLVDPSVARPIDVEMESALFYCRVVDKERSFETFAKTKDSRLGRCEEVLSFGSCYICYKEPFVDLKGRAARDELWDEIPSKARINVPELNGLCPMVNTRMISSIMVMPKPYFLMYCRQASDGRLLTFEQHESGCIVGEFFNPRVARVG